LLAAIGGEEAHVLTLAELAAHAHGAASGGSFVEDTGSGGFGLPAGTVIITGSSTTASAGSNAAHNTMQPFLVINYIIKN
jgi:microcystin-dependent protein